MWGWINGPGAALRDPLPGSTNYLGAYDSRGRLKRLSDKTENSEDDQSVSEIPPERESDLRPFPLNKHFVSERVLSEELRETIWERIMKNGKSVQTVSAELGVEMSRVGAVVRLKEVEKEWARKVRTSISLISHPHSYMMIYKKID
jgi:hypothetical protein